MRDESGETPLICFTDSLTPAEELSASEKRNDLEFLKVLLDSGADIKAHDSPGVTALPGAAGAGRIEIVKALVEHNAGRIPPSIFGGDALIAATHSNHFEVVRFFGETGH